MEGKDIIEGFLCNDPQYRLGGTLMGGVPEVKSHPFFDELDWETLLRQKAEFIPSLEGEEDTSYFDRKQEKGRERGKGGGDIKWKKSGKNYINLCVGQTGVFSLNVMYSILLTL